MDNVQKFLLLLAIIAIVYITLSRKSPAAPVSVDAGDNASPWYVSYNYPSGFQGGSSVLPANSIGYQNTNASPTCDVCSLFPFLNPMQY